MPEHTLRRRPEVCRLYFSGYPYDDMSRRCRGKGFNDFLRSVFDGLLFERAERLVEAYERPIPIVEGNVVRKLPMVSNPRPSEDR